MTEVIEAVLGESDFDDAAALEKEIGIAIAPQLFVKLEAPRAEAEERAKSVPGLFRITVAAELPKETQ